MTCAVVGYRYEILRLQFEWKQFNYNILAIIYRYRFEPPYFVEHALAITHGLFFFFFFNRYEVTFFYLVSKMSTICTFFPIFFLLNCSFKTILVTDFWNFTDFCWGVGKRFWPDFEKTWCAQNSETPKILYGWRPLGFTVLIIKSSTRIFTIWYPSL